MDLLEPLTTLQEKRKIFHSEADFQFALAWEIQQQYPHYHVRLEYCPEEAPNMHIDILVFTPDGAIPIELKYKTIKTSIVIDGEKYLLRNHGAQDIGKYDFLADIQRLEWLSNHFRGYIKGYVLWLSNDTSYWTKPQRPHTVYEAFSVHHGAHKQGVMMWAAHAGAGTTKNRNQPITLIGNYDISWEHYSKIGEDRNSTFRYVLLPVK